MASRYRVILFFVKNASLLNDSKDPSLHLTQYVTPGAQNRLICYSKWFRSWKQTQVAPSDNKFQNLLTLCALNKRQTATIFPQSRINTFCWVPTFLLDRLSCYKSQLGLQVLLSYGFVPYSDLRHFWGGETVWHAWWSCIKIYLAVLEIRWIGAQNSLCFGRCKRPFF